ncbi:unnamed protein product [Cylindrotheca closterium]|uniref:Peptidase M14 domain-containing protein n=1 Tax=Cylindrotheca closterium TaxID=2856 RepID=A0AAD2FF10_9STRA|nr:unnamed protein product [Cylindrotheca closterium]
MGILHENDAAPPKDIQRYYPIGTPGKPWTKEEDDEWKKLTKLQRSYKEEVLDKLTAMQVDSSSNNEEWFEIKQYGSLSHNPSKYPLMAVQSKAFDATKPFVLVTGGVHGYETSGVQGAIQFLTQEAAKYAKDFNLVILPCVSPWAYEHIQRWDAELLDPNRSFQPDDESKQTEESKALISHLKQIEESAKKSNDIGETKPKYFWKCHVDLHETTNTDATEFMPAKHAKAGLPYEGEVIPDGFYLVANNANPQLEFHQAVIDKVKKVTHIAPPDENGDIIGEPVVQEGVIQVPARELGLCGGVTLGEYATTTEVYPDSPKATDEICNRAQVASVVGALEYILTKAG